MKGCIGVIFQKYKFWIPPRNLLAPANSASRAGFFKGANIYLVWISELPFNVTWCGDLTDPHTNGLVLIPDRTPTSLYAEDYN